jgi:FkbM family methyltransferase
MNWSGISDSSLLGKALRFPLRLLPNTTQMPIMQGRLKGKRWIVGSSHHGCWLGSFEFDKQLLFERTITRGSIVFDLGGHVGFYTLLASELVGSNGQVFVFEPVPQNLLYLKEHIRLNHVGNVTVMEAAVSDKSGVVSFDEGPTRSMGHIVATNGKLQVRTVALDELISTGEIPTPDYMKIDIEGAEALALSGAQSMLASAHPTIFLATHGSSVHQECCCLLHSLDYELQPIDGMDLEQSSEILASSNARELLG